MENRRSNRWAHRDPRRLRRQLEERERELAALQADLHLLWRSERFLSWFDPPYRAATAALAREAQ